MRVGIVPFVLIMLGITLSLSLSSSDRRINCKNELAVALLVDKAANRPQKLEVEQFCDLTVDLG